MIHKRSLLQSLLLASLVLAVGQSAPPATAPQAPAKNEGILRLHLMDGSVITGQLSSPQIDVETRFGILKIPLDQIRSFTPGLQSHPEFDKHIADLVADLGADGFAEREKAQAALLKIGPEIKAELERYLKTAEAEKQTRLQKIVDEFDALREGDDEESPQEWVRDDVVVTSTFTVVGKIKTPAFDVSSPYGNLAIKLNDIRSLQRDGHEAEEIRKNVTVSGTLVPARGYEVTSIRLNKGDQVTLTATGTITMTPWGNQVATPDGGPNFGVIQPGNIPGGALMAKIGDSGALFKVGSKHTFTVQRGGILQFGVAMPGDYTSYTFPGEYNVKVRVVRK